MSDFLIPSKAKTGVRLETRWADWAGMAASIGCAIHCAAMPLVLAYLPAMGLGWLADESFHRWMAAICFALAAAAFVPGWRKHRSLVPVTWGAVGLLLLTSAAFGMEGRCCAADSGEAVISATLPACCDDACPLLASAAEGSSIEPEAGGNLAALQPWITPLGGLLLVVGHLSNHRKSCSCQQCVILAGTTDVLPRSD